MKRRLTFEVDFDTPFMEAVSVLNDYGVPFPVQDEFGKLWTTRRRRAQLFRERYVDECREYYKTPWWPRRFKRHPNSRFWK